MNDVGGRNKNVRMYVVYSFSVSSSPLEVKVGPRQKAIHYLHMGQQPSKQNEL
jgi:hypothetical protein